MEPLTPTDTVPLFAPLHEELMTVLRSLGPEDWERPTVAPRWRVRDVAAHLLDGYLRTISALRDGHLAPPEQPLDTYTDLVGFLDRLNAEWVAAARRLSPRVLIELLATSGAEAGRTLAALPPDEPALFSVAWAGEGVSTNWMHVGREYTERWHHQMQIRDAVGAPLLLERRWLHPLLDLSLRALPHAYRAVEAEEGTRVEIEVEGGGGGTWSLLRGADGWELLRGAPAAEDRSDGPPDAAVRLDPDTAWRVLYHALPPAEARNRARVTGDPALAAPFFAARSVMVEPPSNS